MASLSEWDGTVVYLRERVDLVPMQRGCLCISACSSVSYAMLQLSQQQQQILLQQQQHKHHAGMVVPSEADQGLEGKLNM